MAGGPTKRVSVIIPSYNCEKYVGAAVESVLAQSCGKAEIVVIDDGSTDGTRTALEKYFGDIVYIRQENRGLPGARNRGMRECSGEYVAFLDADDLWKRDKLEIQMKVFDAHPAVSIVFSDFSVFSDDGYREESYYKKCFPIFAEYGFTPAEIFGSEADASIVLRGETIPVYRGNILRHLFFGNFILPSSAVIRRSALDRVGEFDEKYRIAEETDFFLRLCTEGEAAFVERPLVDYLVKRAGNLTGSSNTERLIRNAIDIQESYLRRNPGFRAANGRLVERALAGSHARLAYFHLSVARNSEARKEAIRSISLRKAQFPAYSYLMLGCLPSFALEAFRRGKRYLKRFAG